MIISVPHMVSKEDRVRQSSSNLYGNDPQTFRSDYTPWKPGIPQLLLVEQPVPASTVLPHYHSQDQFQIFLDGGGRLGRQEIRVMVRLLQENRGCLITCSALNMIRW